MLSSMNEQLASISGQHAHQSLLKPDHHLSVLDHFGGLMGTRDRVRRSYQKMLPLIDELTDLKRQHSEQAQRRELLKFQCREIHQAAINDGEDRDLEQEGQRLRHGQRLYETVGRSFERLYGAEGAAVEQLSEIVKALQGLSDIDPSLVPVAKTVHETTFQLEDVAHDLRAYMQGLVFDGERLEAVELRLDVLRRLASKYGGSLESVLAHAKEAEAELKRLSSLPEEITELEERLEDSHRRLSKLCRELSRKRKKAAKALAEKVQQGLASLDMSGTRFEVRFNSTPVHEDANPYLVVDDSGVEVTGIDRADFLMAPNVGEELRPLDKIASGGELSRIILSLKAILATQESVETLIFDEVDAGIGGRVAEIVGQSLLSLSRFHQVICITHLPQIAQFGKHHFEIVKGVEKGRTRTTIKPLRGEDRVREMARMLGGVKITKKTLDHAREMVATQGGNES
jgi:DNA repair protein RecN (Recombination protein N)